jgi:hypothetical protein
MTWRRKESAFAWRKRPVIPRRYLVHDWGCAPPPRSGGSARAVRAAAPRVARGQWPVRPGGKGYLARLRVRRGEREGGQDVG